MNMSGIIAKWSFDGKYLAAICKSTPNILWIWSSLEMKLKAVLNNMKPITSLCWNSVKNEALFAC